MKKILAGLCALVVALTFTAIPASAGGVYIGGIVIGGPVIRPYRPYYRPYYIPPPIYVLPPPIYYPPPPVYVQPVPEYYAPEPEYIERCYTKTIRRWDPNTDTYVKVKKRVCK